LADSEDARLRGYDCASFQVTGVFQKDADADSALLTGSKANQPKDSAMRVPAEHRELPKIFIERYQGAPLLIAAREDSFVAGILGPVACPDHVVASSLEVSLGPRR
jgi:hypothetical protein